MTARRWQQWLRLGIIGISLILGVSLLTASPAAASYFTPYWDKAGRYSGQYGWESLNDEVFLSNYGDGRYVVRLRVYVRVDGAYRRYLERYVPDGYRGKFSVVVHPEPTTVRVQACFYNKKYVYVGPCRNFYATS